MVTRIDPFSAVRGVVIPVGIFVLWEVLARAGVLAPMSFSRPSEVFLVGMEMVADGTLFGATLQTLQSVLAGFAIALVLGIAVGVLIGTWWVAGYMLAPTLAALRAVPPIALVPLSLLVFGFGVSMEAAVVAFACIWPIIVSSVAAVGTMDSRVKDVARALEMSSWQFVRYLVLPSAIGRIAVGARIAMGIALVVGITVEIVINPRGLGYGIIIAQQSLRADAMYAHLLWIGCVGWAVNALMILIDTTLLGRFTRVSSR